jgi:hemerythrin-like domain-containing protein
MSFIKKLKQEHEQIERELLELETIINSPTINYPNLIHVYKRLHDFWNKHELTEEKIFPIFKHENIVVPVKKMIFEHGELRPLKEALINAMNSGAKIK